MFLAAKIIGLYPKFNPWMAKVLCHACEVIFNGFKQYAAEVTAQIFPAEENWFGIPEEEFDEL